MDPKLKKILTLGGVISVAAMILLFASFRVVQAGSVQVVTRFGGLTGRILKPGLNLITPFVDNTVTYNTKKVIYETTSSDKQSRSNADYIDYPVDTNTKDGQQVLIFYTVRFSVHPDKVTWIAQNVGPESELVEKIVKTDSRIWARNVPREFDAEQLYTGNVQEIQNKIEEKLKPLYESNGIILDEVGIREIQFTDDYVKAIEAKQIEAVKIQAEKNKAEQSKYQKEARITQAEGQAREQELLRQSITPELIQKLWIEKWNGELPSVMGQGSTLMDISEYMKKGRN
jgi:regulator of protease activity HflC (stomatin/prohibitin superfamily)